MDECPKEIVEHISPKHLDHSMTSVYMKFIELSRNNPDLINFGIGSPDYAIPDFVKQAGIEAMSMPDCHQYARNEGNIEGLIQVAELFSERIGRKIDPETEVMEACGATGAFYNLLEAFLQPGDEVVIFTPMYPFFYPPILHRGAVPVALDLLKTGNPLFDREEFKKVFSKKTRLLMINTPHNPTGKIFTKEELTFISEFLEAEYPNVLVVSDEVYCDFVFKDIPHTYLASVPNMWKKTVSLFSFGKTFHVTGWRIGFAIGPRVLIEAMSSVQLFSTGTLSSPMLQSVAKVIKQSREPFEGEQNYYVWLRKLFASKYEKIKGALLSSPLKLDVLDCEGGYVLLANIEKAVEGMPLKYFYSDFATSDRPGVLNKFEDWRDLDNPDYSPDFAFCFYLIEVYGVILFPVSGMTEKRTLPPKEKNCVQLIRAALCRNDESIAALKLKLNRN